MEQRDVVLIIVAVITIVGSALAAKIAGKSSIKVKELDVDAQAYLNAQVITDGLINNLRTELGRAQEQLSQVHETLNAEREDKAKLKAQLDGLHRTMEQMNRRLIEAGLAPITTYHHHSQDTPPHGIPRQTS